MISSLQHQYLNTHKSKSHGVCTEFKFHLRSEITLVPNTYDFIYDGSYDDEDDDNNSMVSDDDYSNDDIYDNNCYDDKSKKKKIMMTITMMMVMTVWYIILCISDTSWFHLYSPRNLPKEPRF